MRFWKWAGAAGVIAIGVILLIGKDDMIRYRQVHRM